jgi:hypothetical protein
MPHIMRHFCLFQNICYIYVLLTEITPEKLGLLEMQVSSHCTCYKALEIKVLHLTKGPLFDWVILLI